MAGPTKSRGMAADRTRQLVGMVLAGQEIGVGIDVVRDILRVQSGPAHSRPISFITQHMPSSLTAMLAEQIARLTGGTCGEARDGEPVAAGRVYLAPGDHHLLVMPNAPAAPVVRLSRDASENFCRPAVDPMLESLADIYGAGLTAVILTGMGQDGLAGCRALRHRDGQVIVQDEASSVVWGMPGAVARAGLADEILPIPEIAGWLRPRIGSGRGGSGRNAA